MKLTSRIYIAGHNGLVGSAIKKGLEAKGYINIITRTHKELDLINQRNVSDFFEQEKPEYVILAAAKVGGIVANNIYRGAFIYENLMIQTNIIHQSYLHKVKKILFLGSTCIYPKNAPQPMQEKSLLTSELEYSNEPYAIAKIAGIKMCESYNIQYGTNFIALQPTNLYGFNDNFDLEKSHVLPALIRKIHLGKALENNDWQTIQKDLNLLPIEKISGNNKPAEILAMLSKHGISYADNGQKMRNTKRKVNIEIWGSGKPTREFLWSEDMADACVYTMENISFQDVLTSLENKKEIKNTHLNIGTGKEISIKELADMIKKTIGFEGDFYFNTEKPDGTMRKLTDTSKMKSLGWEYEVELKEGIQKLYNWYLK